MLKRKSKEEFRIAVPVYGTRVLPRFGLAREFAIVEIIPVHNRWQQIRHRAWEHWRCPSLASWLRGEGVTGVVCGGIHPRFQQALQDEGLWLRWGYRGEVEDVLRQWLASEKVEQTAERVQVISNGCPRHKAVHPSPCFHFTSPGEKS